MPHWSSPLPALWERYVQFVAPFVWRALALACGCLSILILWSELTLLSSNNLSPFSLALQRNLPSANDTSVDSDRDARVIVAALVPLTYLSVLTVFSLFRLRLSTYYHMNAKHRTDEHSLLVNGSLLLRMFAPLSYNVLLVLRSRGGTAFNEVIGTMDVVPILGTGFNDVAPILLVLVSLGVATNTWQRILNWMKMDSFQDVEVTRRSARSSKSKSGVSLQALSDELEIDADTLNDARLILRREKRKRGIRDEGDSLL